MKTLKLKAASWFALATIVCMNLSSCSDNDEPNDPEEDKPTTNLSSEARKFVGLWKGSITGKNITGAIFYENGTGVFESSSKGWWSGFQWEYNESTRILATTSTFQFEVTLLSDNAWAGITVQSQSTSSWRRNNDKKDYVRALLSLTDYYWEPVNENTIESIHIGDEKSYPISYNGSETGRIFKIKYSSAGTDTYYLKITPTNEDDDTYTFNYTLKGSSNRYYVTKDAGILTIKNPWNLTTVKLVFTSNNTDNKIIDGTYTIKQN